MCSIVLAEKSSADRHSVFVKGSYIEIQVPLPEVLVRFLLSVCTCHLDLMDDVICKLFCDLALYCLKSGFIVVLLIQYEYELLQVGLRVVIDTLSVLFRKHLSRS